MVDVTFYQKKEQRILRPTLFSKTAEALAQSLSRAEGNYNKRSQIRKFYDEVLRLNSLAKTKPEDWVNILPFVNMLIAKAAYAEGRKLVTAEFVDFLKRSIDQVATREDLDVFANFFEAFMGFYRKYGKS